MPKSIGRPRVSTPIPATFFAKQLAGEAALPQSTAQRLAILAMELLDVQPWEYLGDQELLLTDCQEQLCCCSIMGALGEVFSLQVYLGADGYGLFRSLTAQEPITPEEFFATMRGIAVEFVRSGELTSPDRDMLRAFGLYPSRVARYPVFRTFRPGYHPWYVNASEGELLACCMQAVLAFCRSDSAMDFWDKPGVYPLLVQKSKTESSYEIKMVSVPEPGHRVPEMPDLDESLITPLCQGKYPVGNAIEVDHFYAPGSIGGKNERPMLIRMALAAESQSGIVISSELGTPRDSAGDLLLRAVVSAVRSGGFIPAEIRVKNKEQASTLECAARRLGSAVRVSKRLPALDRAKHHLFDFMGGSAV